MPVLDFPSAPTVGQVYDKWQWDGAAWAFAVPPVQPLDADLTAIANEGTTDYGRTFLRYYNAYEARSKIMTTPNPDGTNYAIGNNTQSSISTGTDNAAMGRNAQPYLTTGSGNVALGDHAQNALVSGGNNTAVGHLAMTRYTGDGSTAVGCLTQYVLTTGTGNTAVGYAAQGNATVGHRNTAIGQEAQGQLIDGSENTAIGYWAQRNVLGGGWNVAIGGNAQGNLLTGANNVAIGENAQNGNNPLTTGSCNTSIGHRSGLGSATQSNYITTVGWEAKASGETGIALGAYSHAAHGSSVAFGFGTVTTADNQYKTGSRHYELTEVEPPGAPPVDNVRFYARDNGAGKTVLVARFPTGPEVPIASEVSRGVGSPEGVIAAPVGAKYVDTVATNGAVEWIKLSGTGTTGWKVTYGDTGWWNVKDVAGTAGFLINGWTAAGFDVCRNGDTVFVAVSALNGAVMTADHFCKPPQGFRFTIAHSGVTSDMADGAGNLRQVGGGAPETLYLPGATTATILHGAFTYRTNDPWPVGTMPGVLMTTPGL